MTFAADMEHDNEAKRNKITIYDQQLIQTTFEPFDLV